MLVIPETFLVRLDELYANHKDKRSIFLTFKRDLEGQQADNQMLIRATCGNKKLSTILGQKDHNRFQQALSSLLRQHMDSLRKRDRVRKKKRKTKAT